ncbi:MAG: hypothetical protein CM15mV56_570 [uncultured marine virus]|nr:MAG: hypothetical protein CM15mV56_570 [uncultured marine virus]
MARKFKKVPKTKRGVPKKYVKGSKNQKKTQDEILRTRKMYREGALTPAMMDMISKQRSKSGKKTSKKKTSKKKKAEEVKPQFLLSIPKALEYRKELCLKCTQGVWVHTTPVVLDPESVLINGPLAG